MKCPTAHSCLLTPEAQAKMRDDENSLCECLLVLGARESSEGQRDHTPTCTHVYTMFLFCVLRTLGGQLSTRRRPVALRRASSCLSSLASHSFTGRQRITRKETQQTENPVPAVCPQGKPGLQFVHCCVSSTYDSGCHKAGAQ